MLGLITTNICHLCVKPSKYEFVFPASRSLPFRDASLLQEADDMNVKLAVDESRVADPEGRTLFNEP